MLAAGKDITRDQCCWILPQKLKVPRDYMLCCDSSINPALKLGPNRWQSRLEISNVCALQKPNCSKLRAEAAVGFQPLPCKGK